MFPERSVINYHYSLVYNPEKSSSLKIWMFYFNKIHTPLEAQHTIK